MCEDGWIFFQENYPKICDTFSSVFTDVFLVEEKHLFFNNLLPFYDKTKEYNKNIEQGLITIMDSNLWEKHHLVKFLFWYAPILPLSPNCVNILEESLGNDDIIFEDKPKTLEILKGDRNNFWGRYCELEIANSLSKEGCHVCLLERNKSQGRYPDLDVQLGDLRFNIEVTNRYYNISDKQVLINALHGKIIEEAGQLPVSGINIIIVFFSGALLFSDSMEPKKIINLFDFCDVMYEDSCESESIIRSGCEILRPKRKLILETRAELNHISAVAGGDFEQMPMEKFGKQIRTMQLCCLDSFPSELKGLLAQIQYKDVQ